MKTENYVMRHWMYQPEHTQQNPRNWELQHKMQTSALILRSEHIVYELHQSEHRKWNVCIELENMATAINLPLVTSKVQMVLTFAPLQFNWPVLLVYINITWFHFSCQLLCSLNRAYTYVAPSKRQDFFLLLATLLSSVGKLEFTQSTTHIHS